MVNTRTGGVNFLGSVRITDGIFLFGGSGYRLKLQQVGASFDVGLATETTRGRRLSNYIRVGVRGQRESSQSNRPVDWHMRLVTDVGARLCAGRICGSLGFPVVWVKPQVIDVAAGITVGVR